MTSVYINRNIPRKNSIGHNFWQNSLLIIIILFDYAILLKRQDLKQNPWKTSNMKIGSARREPKKIRYLHAAVNFLEALAVDD